MNKGIMLNIDDTHYWYSRYKIGAHPDEADLRAYIRQYQSTQVTDLALCIAGRIACFPSKTVDGQLDKFRQTRENGLDVDYTRTLYALADELDRKGLDVFAIWLDEARKCGIRPWLSVRMNDCHENSSPASFLHPNFFHEHPECRRVRHREPDAYYDRCYDYELKAVRDRMLALIEEILTRFAPDGLELDWQREMFCFRPGHESRAVLTGFMRDVRALVQKTEAACGHAVPVCVRVPPLPEDALEMGFDIAAWADEGLVQVVCPTARWASTDNDMPVGLWKRLLRGTDVCLAPGIELLIRSMPEGPVIRTDECHVTAAAAQFFSEGADKIYLFNYFDDPDPANTYWTPAEGQTNMAVRAEGMARLLALVGDPERVMAAERCHMMTYHDLRPMWRAQDRPLPLALTDGEPLKMLRIVTGTVPKGMKVLLRLGVKKNEKTELRVWINSRSVTFIEKTACVPAYTASPLYVYELPEGLDEGAAVIELGARNGNAEIDYADMTLLPA